MLFCGINPSLYSAATGWHFARPGNRFWPGPAPVRVHPAPPGPARAAPAARLWPRHHQPGGPRHRAGRRARRGRIPAGGERLLALLAGRRPGILAIAGVTAYRTAFGQARAEIGPQPAPLGASRVWVLPNPSGLNAHWTLDAIAAQFAALRAAASPEDQTHLSRTTQVPAPASPASQPRPRQSTSSAPAPPQNTPSRPLMGATMFTITKIRSKARAGLVARGAPWRAAPRHLGFLACPLGR